ncbi:MAG: SurA N-terminal domain-containing protein [Bacteroidales bacterium]|nr:SurA N-terminal domain-containing protein [Bacteroidales bacterium]
MATLEKIRNKAGILVAIVIGLALIAFILGDMFKPGSSSLSSKSQNEIAEVSGKSIPVQLYYQKIEETVENYKRNTQQTTLDEATIDKIREQTWDNLIRDFVMSKEYKKIGLGISSDELFDIVQGNNISPQIKQIPIFQNQTTGAFDRTLVIQFLKNIDRDPSGNARKTWIAFEQGLSQERINTKYNNLIKKGLYVTKYQANKEIEERYNKVDFEYIAINVDYLPDSSISYTEEDLINYLENNKNKYQQTKSRDIEYITFNIAPSPEDDKLALEWIKNIIPDFENTEDNIQFVNLNSDTPFDNNYYKKGEYQSTEIDSFLFSPENEGIYGPYFEDKSYRLAKLIKTEYLPDSVKARHILIQPNEELDITQAQQIVDSLKTLVENGADFAQLAEKHGTDATKDSGGDLGWFEYTAMVQPFNDTCFFSKKGHLTTVVTQFGVHLVEVTDKSEAIEKVQVAVLERKIEPSSKTYQFIYSQAGKFSGLNNTKEKFYAAIKENNYDKKVVNNLTETDKKIPGLESPRELIRWAYKANNYDVSPVFEFGSQFVVAILTEVREKGIAPLDLVREEIELLVKKEKKSENIIEDLKLKLNAGSNIESIAKDMNLEVKTCNNVNFSSYSVPGIGIEPNLSGAAVCLAKDKISDPIKGNRAIFVIKVISSTEADENADTEKERSYLARGYQSRVNYQTFEALKEIANIQDYRAKFY